MNESIEVGWLNLGVAEVSDIVKKMAAFKLPSPLPTKNHELEKRGLFPQSTTIHLTIVHLL
ncbi:hypothetical protein DERF_015768 [Dermatophagoides farinae]|uniref:Uncharacterized protein n=1 Tax=Dermatophagoides farinae TaxID=6954 RepID=A0A922HKB8_DERFA|nr:hypothetical protein DERF_015768 [Dermatophagoides farinae]